MIGTNKAVDWTSTTLEHKEALQTKSNNRRPPFRFRHHISTQHKCLYQVISYSADLLHWMSIHKNRLNDFASRNTHPHNNVERYQDEIYQTDHPDHCAAYHVPVTSESNQRNLGSLSCVSEHRVTSWYFFTTIMLDMFALTCCYGYRTQGSRKSLARCTPRPITLFLYRKRTQALAFCTWLQLQV